MFHYESVVAEHESKLKYTKLRVFDFDSTLFKSPLPNPDLWTHSFLGTIVSDCQWFCDPRTLSAPYVPQIPSTEWWNHEIVEIAKERSPTTLNVLLTGRRKELFLQRITELCQCVGLDFDCYFCKETACDSGHSGTTLDFKLSVIEHLIDSFGNIRDIELYDDREKHVARFSSAFECLVAEGRIDTFTTRVITIPEADHLFMDSELEKQLVFDLVRICNERISYYRAHSRSYNNLADDRDPATRRVSISKFRKEIVLQEHIYYTEIVLDPSSILQLKKQFPTPAGWKWKGHHLTISFGKQNDTMVEQLGGVGSRWTLKATHIGTLPNIVTALKIEPQNLVSENEVMHVTLFVSPVGNSKQANSIVQWEPLGVPLEIQGTVMNVYKLGPKKEVVPPMEKKEVSIGELVKLRFPNLQGREIGKAVRFIQDWMEKTFIENLDSNRALIEWKIQTLTMEEIQAADCSLNP
jgi:hypothetical protein